MKTFNEEKNKVVSEKITLAWLEPSRRKIAGWELESEAVYKAKVDHFVVGVYQNGEALSAGLSGAGSYSYDPHNGMLYVWSLDGESPALSWTEVEYRLFFSSAPVNLPWDLQSGDVVPYLPIIEKGSGGSAKLEDSQTGTAIEGSGTLSLTNDNITWDTIIDKYTFQTKDVVIFHYFRGLPASEAKVTYRGVIVSYSYGGRGVSFKLKDEIFKFRADVVLPRFSEADGSISESLIGKPKRRVYGRIAGLQIEALDQMLKTYTPVEINEDDTRSGSEITFSTALNSRVVTASDPGIYKELCAGDSLTLDGKVYKVNSLKQVSLGITSDKTVTFSRFSAGIMKFECIGIDSLVELGETISFSRLVNGSQTLRDMVLDQFVIIAKGGNNIRFAVPSLPSSFTEIIKVKPGEVIVTRIGHSPQFLLQQDTKVVLTNASGSIKPQVPYRRFNRKHFLTHHAISEVTTQVAKLPVGLQVELNTVESMAVGDYVTFDGTKLTRITAINPVRKMITLEDFVVPKPAVGEELKRLGVQKVTHNLRELTPLRDFTVVSSGQGSVLTLSTYAERDSSPQETLLDEASWLDGSMQVYSRAGGFKDFKVRDWIRPAGSEVWYEINEVVNDFVAILCEPYDGDSGYFETEFKQPDYVDDKTKLFIDTYGITENNEPGGQLIRTAAGVVKHLLNEIGITALDDSSFDDAMTDAPHLMSLVLPRRPRGDIPSVKQVIKNVNDSVFGSLFYDFDFRMRYLVVSADRKLGEVLQIKDTDVLDSDIKLDAGKIYRNVVVRYRHQDVDSQNKDSAFAVAEVESEFVKNSLIEPQTLTEDIFLFEAEAAAAIAHRLALVYEMPASTLTLTTKLALVDIHLNQLVLFESDGLYERLGSTTEGQYRLGLVQSVTKGPDSVKIVVTDLGNIFNRTAVIASAGAADFSDASDLDRMFHGFIAESSGLIGDDEQTFNTNLIS